MIKETADNIAAYMSEKGLVTSELQEVYSYGFECLLATTLQVLILLLFALPFGMVTSTVTFLLGFASLKRWIGGYHARSHRSCFWQSSLLVVIGVVVSAAIPPALTAPVLWGLAGAVILLVFWRAPIVHPNRPKTKEQIQNLAKKSRLAAVILGGVLVLASFLAAERLASLALSLGSGGFGAAATLCVPKSAVERRNAKT